MELYFVEHFAEHILQNTFHGNIFCGTYFGRTLHGTDFMEHFVEHICHRTHFTEHFTETYFVEHILRNKFCGTLHITQ